MLKGAANKWACPHLMTSKEKDQFLHFCNNVLVKIKIYIIVIKNNCKIIYILKLIIYDLYGFSIYTCSYIYVCCTTK